MLEKLLDHLVRQAPDRFLLRQVSAAVGTGVSVASEGASTGFADANRHGTEPALNFAHVPEAMPTATWGILGLGYLHDRLYVTR